MTQPYDVEFASEQYQQALIALKEKAMLATLNQSQAMMRAVLSALRDSVSDEDALLLANALPALARGIMLEGWRLQQPKVDASSPETFHKELVRRLGPHQPPPEDLAEAAFAVWAEALTAAAGRVFSSKLPEALRGLWLA